MKLLFDHNLGQNDAVGMGEHTRPACIRRRPAAGFSAVPFALGGCACAPQVFAAGRRDRHARGVRYPWQRLNASGLATDRFSGWQTRNHLDDKPTS
jgi:hypothetical protein